MPTRLSGLDASFLYLETRTSHMHVASAIILDPSTAAGGLTFAGYKDYLARRLHLAPPFRRRLVQVPFRLDHPRWIEDPDFDLDYHVRRAALPAPGGMAELAEFTGDFMSRSLDRRRPLWEVWMVEGLEGGRVAVLSKTHHAAVDGVSGAELLAAMLQLEPGQEPDPPEQTWQPESKPSELRLLAGAGAQLALRPWQAVGVSRRVLSSATGLLRFSFAQKESAPPSPFAAPVTSLNGAIGPHRRIAFAEIDLDGVKEVKNTLGGTVNDVVLAVVAGALRRYFSERGEPVDEPLVAMVPISTHEATPEGGGNSVSAMLTELPVDEADPARRLKRVSAATKGAKEQHGALGASTLQHLAELAPAGVSALAARLYTRVNVADRHRPIWNLVVSNVPGPRFPLYCAGARVEAMYPLGPVHEMSGLNVTLFSYQDTIFLGINADRELVPDVWAVGRALCDAADEMAKAARDEP
jgi:diacylglycerol O-acyltransferase / wax synthase